MRSGKAEEMVGAEPGERRRETDVLKPAERKGTEKIKEPVRDKDGLTEAEFLAAYRPGDFVRPSVATDMVIFTVTDREEENYRKIPKKELRILLIKRGGHPFLKCWALPGGFVRPTETTEQTASRELREETGVEKVYLEQLYTFSQPKRDPRTWVMSCSYMALIDSSQAAVQAGDDAEQAAWFEVKCRMLEHGREEEEREWVTSVRRDQEMGTDGEGGQEEKRQLWELTLSHEDTVLKTILEKGEGESFTESRIVDGGGLAFDHGCIIAYGLERLRGKLNYTDLAFHLMPERFTLTQLKQVYEVILDKELLAAAFRRKVMPMVEETNEYTENEGHRPSRLYRRKKKKEKGEE